MVGVGVLMIKILIVEDEVAINNLIKLNLELVGYECEQVYDGAEALKKINSYKYAMIILDVMLPKCSGFELISHINHTPVIFLTAKADINDKIRGLKLGADDYIVKPFEMLELIERVRAVLRRANVEINQFEFDDIRVELDNRRIYKANREVVLKPREFDLLETFIRNRNIALSREKLIEFVWDFDYDGDLRTVDIHVQRLRQKLGISSRLQTVYKTGYRFEV